MLEETVAISGIVIEKPLNNPGADTRPVASIVFDAPGAIWPRFQFVPVEVSVLRALLPERKRRFLLYVVDKTTLSAGTSPLFATVRWYTTSVFGAVGLGASTVAVTFKFGLCPPKSMSPFQSPAMLKTPNMNTMLTTLAVAYASPVLILETPFSVVA